MITNIDNCLFRSPILDIVDFTVQANRILPDVTEILSNTCNTFELRYPEKYMDRE